MSKWHIPRFSLALLMLLGLLAGAGGSAVVAIAFLAMSLLAAWPLFYIIGAGFGGLSTIVLVLLGVLLFAIAAPFIARWVWRRLAGIEFFSELHDIRSRVAFFGGALVGVAIALSLVPGPYKDDLIQSFTGMKPADRASLPTTDGARERMVAQVRPAAEAGDPVAQVEWGLALQYGAAGEPRDLEMAASWMKRAAAQPEGYEGQLLVAINKLAAPVPSPGRILTEEDAGLKAAALRSLVSRLPPDWHPIALGAAAESLNERYDRAHSGDAQREAFAEAGRAGSRVYTVLVAMIDEREATAFEKVGREDEAKASWSKAQQGYASAGALFEVARLRVETLPERLAQFPDPPPLANWPVPDKPVADRFWRFAMGLDAADVSARTPPSQRDLASVVALLAVERAPTPLPLATLAPRRWWSGGANAAQRHVLALRHARGDCAAALELSNVIRFRQQNGFSHITPGVSMHDLAWAMAWAEVAERCAPDDDFRAQASERRTALVAMYISKADAERARAGVADTIGALR